MLRKFLLPAEEAKELCLLRMGIAKDLALQPRTPSGLTALKLLLEIGNSRCTYTAVKNASIFFIPLLRKSFDFKPFIAAFLAYVPYPCELAGHQLIP